MSDPRFAAMKTEPWWWQEAPRPSIPNRPLPARADVAIVGAGYTGLNAALVLARAGRSVVVFDAEDAAWGCSARNGGQIADGVKPGFETLARRYGDKAARAIVAAGRESLNHTLAFVEAEGIACDLHRGGRLIGAHRPSRYDALARHLAEHARIDPFDWHMVPPGDMAAELGTEAYCGGAVMEHHASLQPAKYANGLIRLALAAGATIETGTPVLTLAAAKDGSVEVTTARGRLRARDAVLATNGYSGPIAPGLRRRVIPIGSYMIATEPLAAETMAKIMPRQRSISDTRKVVYYYRASPDGRRVIFGGRVALKETDPAVSAPRLHREMTGLFPELAAAKVSHSWLGFVAYTFDEMPHIGRRDGLWFAMGYCGAGVAWASWMGHKLGHKVLGAAEGATPFDDLAFPTRAFYRGDPWFLAAAVAWHRAMDRWGP